MGLIVLAGCGSSLGAHTVDLPDGRKVVCVTSSKGGDIGVPTPDCDWDHAR